MIQLVLLSWTLATGFVAPPDEPEEAALTCQQVSDLYDAAQHGCAVQACAALDDDDLAGRRAAEQENANCAFRYEWVLDRIGDTCDLDPYDESRFPLVDKALRFWTAAYMCAPDYSHRVYIERALSRVVHALDALRQADDDSTAANIEYLEQRQVELTTLDPSPPTAKTTSCPECTTVTAQRTPLYERFTVQLGVGAGDLRRLTESGAKTTTYLGEGVALSPTATVGARFLLGERQRHLLLFGVAYHTMLQRLGRLGGAANTQEMALEHPLDEQLVWVHDLGVLARYGHRVHSDHFTPYGQIHFGFQVFSKGSNFGTSVLSPGLGVCLLWQVLCIEGTYFGSWGGNLPRKTNYATGWTATLGVDILRIPAALEARLGS